MDDYILQSEQVADEIAKAYYKASRMVEKDMVKVIQGLSALSDTRTAIRVLKSNPSKRLLNRLRNAVQTMPDGKEKQEALTLLASPAYQFRLRRLQETIDTARKRCENLYKIELNDTTEHLRTLYSSAFSRTIYDIDRGYNTLHTFSLFPASRVDKLLRSRWSGLNYSERIWNSTQDLADVLKEQLLISFMTGASVSETSRVLREQFQSSAYAARRLVRTETNFIANQAELDSYKRLGIKEYQYIATLDTRTSKQCQRLDMQVFNVDDAKSGINYPPMHPNCRSTTIMYDAEESIKERIARDKNGKPIHVPGNMKYSEWLEKYHPELVDKTGGSGIINLAKQIDMFDFSAAHIGDPFTNEALNEELAKSDIGREILKFIDNLPQPIKFTYGYYKEGYRGEQIGDQIYIYLNNCKNITWVARTVIHEVTHYQYGIGESQWSECVCIAQELKHARGRNKLTTQELRMIVGAVKSEYNDKQWRRGGIINGRRKSH